MQALITKALHQAGADITALLTEHQDAIAADSRGQRQRLDHHARRQDWHDRGQGEVMRETAFNADRHEYTIDGRVVPSVTRVVRTFAPFPFAALGSPAPMRTAPASTSPSRASPPRMAGATLPLGDFFLPGSSRPVVGSRFWLWMGCV